LFIFLLLSILPKWFSSAPGWRLFLRKAGVYNEYLLVFLIRFPLLSHLSYLTFLFPYLVNISSPYLRYFLFYFLFLFLVLSSLTLSAYLNVFNVCSELEELGEIFPIIIVLHFPINESFRTIVNLLPLKGLCLLAWSKALIHSFKANSDLLISAPSILVYLLLFTTSAPLSDPARSINDIFPIVLFYIYNENYKIAWDLEEFIFAPVVPLTLNYEPRSII